MWGKRGDWVLVTGGAGYVGSLVTRRLLEQGKRVRVLDNLTYGDHGLADIADNPRLELLQGDICDREAVASATRGAQRVIALAAVVGDAACEVEPQWSMAVNYQSTELLMEACKKAGVERVVFASSCSVYGANGSKPLDENSSLNPVSLYARTRIMSEEVLQRYARDVEVVTLRLATVCGVSPRMRFDLMVNTMTAFAHSNGAIRVSGGEQWRPHVHVRDAADAFVLASEVPLRSGSVYNVGSDRQNFTIQQVAEKVAEKIKGVRVDHVSANGDRRSYHVSFDRIRNELGFTPHHTVDDAIDEVRDLLASGVVRDFAEDRYHNVKWLNARQAHRGAA